MVMLMVHLKSFGNYGIIFFIIMKDEGPKVFKLVKINSATDFLKNPRYRVLSTT